MGSLIAFQVRRDRERRARNKGDYHDQAQVLTPHFTSYREHGTTTIASRIKEHPKFILHIKYNRHEQPALMFQIPEQKEGCLW